MFCFIGSQKSCIDNEILDNNGGMLVLYVVIDNENFTLIIVYPELLSWTIENLLNWH